jgi:alpha-N-acetylglucosamine transferase
MSVSEANIHFDCNKTYIALVQLLQQEPSKCKIVNVLCIEICDSKFHNQSTIAAKIEIGEAVCGVLIKLYSCQIVVVHHIETSLCRL